MGSNSFNCFLFELFEGMLHPGQLCLVGYILNIFGCCVRDLVKSIADCVGDLVEIVVTAGRLGSE